MVGTNGSNGNGAKVGTDTVKMGLAQMLKGGVIVSLLLIKMKLHTFALPLITLFARTGYAAADLCLGACSTPADGTKECTFTVKLDLHAS